jgi:hypothetical protein
MKDARVRYNRAERDAVRSHRVRCFCLSNRNLSGADMAAASLTTWSASQLHAASRGLSSTQSTRVASIGSTSQPNDRRRFGHSLSGPCKRCRSWTVPGMFDCARWQLT